MSIILCPECNKQISSKATACPGCGCPISFVEPVLNNSTEPSTNVISRPNIHSDLSIGSQVINWGGNAAVKGFFDPMLNSDKNISEGNGGLMLHKNGLRVAGKFYIAVKDIHHSQIINIQCVPRASIFEADKSVIKRAAVGSILLGPLGAIIGGMSGIGSKKQYISLVVVNYWDVLENSVHTLLLSTDDESTAKKFCDNASKLLLVN